MKTRANPERRKKFRRIFAYILVSAAGLYAVFFLLSVIIVNGYDSVDYQSGGFGIVMDQVTVDMKSGDGHITCRSSNDEITLDTDITVSEKDLRELKLKMAFSLAPFWFPRYVDPMILDGNQWRFYFYSGDSQKYVYGSNAEPFGLSGIEKLFYELEYEAMQNLQE